MAGSTTSMLSMLNSKKAEDVLQTTSYSADSGRNLAAQTSDLLLGLAGVDEEARAQRYLDHDSQPVPRVFQEMHDLASAIAAVQQAQALPKRGQVIDASHRFRPAHPVTETPIPPPNNTPTFTR